MNLEQFYSNNALLSMNMNGTMYKNDMPVYWVNSYSMGHIWFSTWIVDEPGTYVILLIGIFLLSFLNQFFHFLLTIPVAPVSFNCLKRKGKKKTPEEYTPLSDMSTVKIESDETSTSTSNIRVIFKQHVLPWTIVVVIKPFAYLFQYIVSGFLMLTIMKYNVGAFFVLSIANTLGYFVFSLFKIFLISTTQSNYSLEVNNSACH